MSSIYIKQPPDKTSQKKCFSQTSYIVFLVTVIILSIILIIVLILYFSQSSSKIDPKNCPPKVTGLLTNTSKKVKTPASNCGTVSDCRFTVTSIQGGSDICTSLGRAKCAQFSLEQVNNSNNYTMVVSSSLDTENATGSDVFQPL